jgi:hypothetical protein
MKLPRVSAVIALFVATASAAPSARQQAPGSTDVIYACLQRNDRFRIVERDERCRANEVRVSWNVEGLQGPAGPAGPVGPQGIPGQTGPQGSAGATGAAGPQGTQGTPGATGTPGANGTNGLNGTDGAPGAAGPRGETGLTGPAGATGLSGAVGLQGPAGTNGATGTPGAIGPMGLTGAQGNAGPQGVPGLAGAIGAIGPIGPAGPTGPQGAVGSQGVAGNDGAAGAPGAIGPIGPQGIAGAAGAVGPTGPQGPAGANGANGLNGADGAAGVAGPQGLQGPAGANGAAGAKGDTGLRGLQGVAGPAGPAGPASAVIDEDTALVYAPNIALTIPGSGKFVPLGISRVGFDIPLVDVTTSQDTYRRYNPGPITAGTLTLVVPSAIRDDMEFWFSEITKGKTIKKTLTLDVVSDQDTPLTRVTMIDCSPISYEGATGTITVAVGKYNIVTLRPIDPSFDDDSAYVISSSTQAVDVIGGTSGLSYASAISGGAEIFEPGVAATQYQGAGPGRKSISLLSLRLTSAAQNVAAWINAPLNNQNWERDVVVTTLHGGGARKYYDAFPTRVTIVSALRILSNGKMAAGVDLIIKPIRLEVP